MPAAPLGSPDTRGARWQVSADGQAIDFGQAGEQPLLTLACQVRGNPPQLRIIRHVAARPGEKALFPVLGTGNSRFKVDATLHDGEWRWEGALPASDPLFDVFETTGKLEATLPGGGSLMIEGSRIPGEFVRWCRAGGKTAPPAVPATPAATEPRAG